MESHYVEIKVDEEGYADASSDVYGQAEASATSFPVVYPEPYQTIGCGWGMAGEFVKRCAIDLANDLGLDWDCNHQIEIQITLHCGSPALYAEFRAQLGQKLQALEAWVRIKP